MGKPLTPQFDGLTSLWRAEWTTRDAVEVHFPAIRKFPVGDDYLLMHDGAVCGFATVANPSNLGPHFLVMPDDARYLSYIFVSPKARGLGFRGALCSLLDEVYARGGRWMVLNTNDWNEKMLIACDRAGFHRLGVGRRLADGSRRYRAAKAMHWGPASESGDAEAVAVIITMQDDRAVATGMPLSPSGRS